MRNIILATVFLGYSLTGLTQEKPDTTTQLLNEVVITAQRVKRSTKSLPYSIGTVRQANIHEMNARTTPEALMSTNGVFVQKTNHGGGSPFVRGLTGNQTLVLIDGIRLNNATFRYGPNQYLNTIDVFTIDQIEVAKGTGSVQYGSDAIGGVVHLLTRSPEFNAKKSFNAQVAGKLSSADIERTGRAETHYSGKTTAILAGITIRHFDDLTGGDTTGKQSPSGYKEWSADIKSRHAFNQNIELVIAGQVLRQLKVPVYHKFRLENFAVNEMDPQQRILGYARLIIKGKPILKETVITASLQQQEEGRNSRKNTSTTLRREKDETLSKGLTIDILSAWNKQLASNSGIEFYHDKINSERSDRNTVTGTKTTMRGLYPDNARYASFSMYSLQHFQYGRWMIDAGARFNYFDIRISDTSLGNVKLHPSALVFNGAILFSLDEKQNVYLSYSNGYRAPNVDDMGTLGIVDFRYEIPSSSLRSEKSDHTELGYKFQSAKLGVTAALFYMNLRDMITRVRVEGQVINGYPVYKKENTEEANIKGFETSVSWRPIRSMLFSGAINYHYGKNETKNEPLRRMPPFNGRFAAEWRKKKWVATSEWRFAGKQSRLAQGDKDDNRIPAGGTPGWNLINLYGGYKLNRVELNIALQNILNTDYRLHGSGINGAGRSASLLVIVKI